MIYRSHFRVLNISLILILLACFFLFGPIVHAESSSSEAMLEIGPIVNARMKALAVSTAPEHEGEVLDIMAKIKRYDNIIRGLKKKERA